MCEACWDEYGRPDIVNEKTEAALRLVRQVYAAPRGGAGGHLHIVLDDWNLEDSSIKYCQAGRSAPNWFGPPMRWTLTDVEAQCAAAFLGMTLQERASTLAQLDGYGSSPEPEPEVRVYTVGRIPDQDPYVNKEN